MLAFGFPLDFHWLTEENIVLFFVGLFTFLGILKIVLPECRSVVRSLWRDYVSAVEAVDEFQTKRRARKKSTAGLATDPP